MKHIKTFKSFVNENETSYINENKLSRKDLEELKKNIDGIKLSDGTIVYAIEQDMKGMAGEPVSYIAFFNEVGKSIKYKDFSNKLTRKDKSELEDLMKQIDDENSRQAHQWAR
jgi:hypothetical protein